MRFVPRPVLRPRHTPTRALAAGAVATLALAACGDDPDLADAPDLEIGAEADVEDDPGDGHPTDEDAPDDGAEAGEAPADGETTDAGTQDDDGAEPLEGDASSQEATADAQGHGLTVTDVRVSSHRGFDRLVFELDGEQPAGYHVGYVEGGDATAQGSGEPIEVAGDQALDIALHGIALLYDTDEDTEAWDGDRVDGPEGGAILEVVEDTIFEGVHTFVAGTDEQHDFLVERLEDPQRIVIDIHHE